MPGFNGTGPGGMGPITGGGRGFCSPLRVRTAARIYGHANWNSYPFPNYGFSTFYPKMTREQGLELLKNQAMAMKRQLSEIETRVKELEKK